MAVAVEEPKPEQKPEQTPEYKPIPLLGLAGRQPLPFPLYLCTGEDRWVLYQHGDQSFDRDHESRLRSEGVEQLHILKEDCRAYARRVESELDLILKDRTLPVEERAEILVGVATEVCEDLFQQVPDKESIQRARTVMASTCSLVVREATAFKAIRMVLGNGAELTEHSLAVGMLCVGLAHNVIGGGDPATLLVAGLAGLLHDIGRIGEEPAEERGEEAGAAMEKEGHTIRGARLLKSLGLCKDVWEAALYHHERHDGSGFPEGLEGEEIPFMARVVGLANTFHRLYAHNDRSPGIYDSLRIMAHVYRGCFDAELAGGLVRLFRG